MQWIKSGKPKPTDHVADRDTTHHAADAQNAPGPDQPSDTAEPHTRKGSALRGLLSSTRARRDEVATQTGPWPHKEEVSKKVVLLAAAAALACGPLALMRGHSQATATTPAPSTTTMVSAAEQRQAEWVATQFFTRWASTTNLTQGALLSQLVNPPVNPMFPQKAPAGPTSVQLVSAINPRPGLWQITLCATGGSFTNAWFMVPVDVTDTSVAVDSLPSPVAPLNTTPNQATTNQVDPASAPGRAAAGLVTTLLSGGDSATLERWTVPTFTPIPVGQVCTKTTIVGISASNQDQNTLAAAATAAVSAEDATGDPASASPTAPGTPSGPVVHAVVSVTATCTQPSTTRLVSYRVGLTNSGGQWSVEQVN